MSEDEYFDFAQRVASDMGIDDVEMELLPYGILSRAGIMGEVTWGLAERNADGSLITICAPPGRSSRAVNQTIVHEMAHLRTDMSHGERWRETYHHYLLKYGQVASSREEILISVGTIAIVLGAAFLVLRHKKL